MPTATIDLIDSLTAEQIADELQRVREREELLKHLLRARKRIDRENKLVAEALRDDRRRPGEK